MRLQGSLTGLAQIKNSLIRAVSSYFKLFESLKQRLSG